MNLLNLTYAQLEDLFRQKYNRGAFHATALYRAFYRTPHFDLNKLPEFSSNPRLSAGLERDMAAIHPKIVAQKSEDGVTKLVFQLHDGLRIETVVIPMANHSTVCISCQAGCRMGCRFCQTGRKGWRRHLSTDEIVAQVYAIKVGMGIDVRNVVFMGMGEPLDNFDQVVHAIRVMEDQRGLNIAKRRITVSTVGLPGQIERLASLDWPQLKLAVSLNAPGDIIRDRIMPANIRFPMQDLKEALKTYPLARGNALFVEYVLIKDVNDDPRYAVLLADYLKNLPVKLNLIPYNPWPQSPFKAPGEEAVQRFHQALVEQKVFVRMRSSKGAGIRAACGQLGGG